MARDAASGVGGAEEGVSHRSPAPACPYCGYSYAATDASGIACPSCGKVRPLLVEVFDDVPIGEETNTQLWRAASWASSWFRDALAEARHAKGDLDARRREILFAVCSIESYLYEWTRGFVGPREVDEYFPPGSKAGIRDKWKDVPKELAVNQKIRAAPSLGGSDWVEFRQLVTYRDGLVHANASRATSDAKPDALPPVPSPDDLRDMEPGWPVRVVADLVRSLHAAVGSSPPHWLVNPQWVAKPAVSPPSAIEVGSRRDATARWRLYSALHGPR